MDAISPTGKVSTFLAQLNAALEAQDAKAASALFAADSYWRDLVALTWNIKTSEGRAAIADMLTATLPSARLRDLKQTGDATEANGVAEGWFTFETAVGRGKGHLRLKPEGCWTLLTTLVDLKGHEEKKGRTREMGAIHGADPHRKSWAERRAAEQAELGYSRQPEVVIVGGGQGGIALGARLRRLGVDTIILERNDRAGDSWRKRYKSLCLHDPVWYDHLPYLPFPDHWPVFSPKDKLGDWLESYVKIMELNYWTKSAAQSAVWDDANKEWTVTVDRDGEKVVLRPKNLVLATGMSGVPNIPDIAGISDFEGDIHHSSKHPGPDAYAGKKCVVIGSNNSAHDISAALWEAGADVTMVQRSSTHIARSDTLMELALGALYSEDALANGIDTNTADLIFASIPYAVLPSVQKPMAAEMKKRDAAFYERLEKAGFLLDFSRAWNLPSGAMKLSHAVLEAEEPYLEELVAASVAGVPWRHTFPNACLRCGKPGSWRSILQSSPNAPVEQAWRYQRPENAVPLCHHCTETLELLRRADLQTDLAWGLWGPRFEAFWQWHKASQVGRLPNWDSCAHPLWPAEFGGQTWETGSGSLQHAEPRPPHGIVRSEQHEAAMRRVLFHKRFRGRQPGETHLQRLLDFQFESSEGD